MADSRLRIVVTGLIAQHPYLGGVTWDYLQYPVGLARLGHDVYYFEDSGQWPYTIDGGPSGNEWIAYDCSHNVHHLASVMARFGLEGRWAYRFPTRPRWFGLSRTQREAVLASADLLINVSGTLRRPQDYRQVRRLAYLDSDPVFTQIKLKLTRGQLKFQKRLAAHDVFFTFGERSSDAVPPTGHRWRPTRQPILLTEWRPSAPHGEAFTTVMSWTSYKPLRYRGRLYGQKDVELKRFLGLPRKARPTVLEVALSGTDHLNWQTQADESGSDQPPRDERAAPGTPRELLLRAGWRVTSATETCAGLDRYRSYIESSKAEWSVAKNGYVQGQSGWFSCRSACYLAIGRPVVVQDTGFGDVLPVGEGLLSFRSLDEAIAGIREIEGNYARHARTARAIANEYFDSARVLARLIDDAMSDSQCGEEVRQDARARG